MLAFLYTSNNHSENEAVCNIQELKYTNYRVKLFEFSRIQRTHVTNAQIKKENMTSLPRSVYLLPPTPHYPPPAVTAIHITSSID